VAHQRSHPLASDERERLDLAHVNNWSLKLGLMILAGYTERCRLLPPSDSAK
jgi:hypothetical protein